MQALFSPREKHTYIERMSECVCVYVCMCVCERERERERERGWERNEVERAKGCWVGWERKR